MKAASDSPAEDTEQTVNRLSDRYLKMFGLYPPVHRMPPELAIQMIEAALKSDQPLDDEPFAGSGCNCA